MNNLLNFQPEPFETDISFGESYPQDESELNDTEWESEFKRSRKGRARPVRGRSFRPQKMKLKTDISKMGRYKKSVSPGFFKPIKIALKLPFVPIKPWPVVIRPWPPYPFPEKKEPNEPRGADQAGDEPGGDSSPDQSPTESPSEYVRWVQSCLNQIMGLRLPIDGIMNAATRSAVRSFQERQGLPVDGLVGPDTEQALRTALGGQFSNASAKKSANSGMSSPLSTDTSPTASEFDFEWERGSPLFENPLFEISKPKIPKRKRKGYVKWLQLSLNKVFGLKLATDGLLGAQTRSAIRNFQQKMGLKADGVVGPKTEQALIKANLPLSLTVSKLKSAKISSQKLNKINAQRLPPSRSKQGEFGIEIDPIAHISTIFNNEGDVSWELDQMKEAKHPWNQEKWGSKIWITRSEDFYQGMDTVLGDEISAKFRINYKFNGHSVGYFVIENINTEDAAFWGLKVTAKISPDPNAYKINGKQPIAAVEVYYNYKFSHFFWDDKIYSGKIKFYGDGNIERSGQWTQG